MGGRRSFATSSPRPAPRMKHSSLRLLPLGEARPSGLKENVDYRGSRRRYGQILFGTPGAARVNIVVDETKDGDADLYVDTGRRGMIDAKDRVAGAENRWRAAVPAAVVTNGKTSYHSRNVLFRLSRAT